MATALTPQTEVTSEKVTWLMENPRQQHDWVYLLTPMTFFCLRSYKCEFLTDTSRGNSALGHYVSSVCSTRLLRQSRPGISAGPLPIPGIHQRPADRMLGPCLFLAYISVLQIECWDPAYSWHTSTTCRQNAGPLPIPGIHQCPADRVLGPCLFLAYINDLQTECWDPAYSWQETVSSPSRRFPRTTPSCTASSSVS